MPPSRWRTSSPPPKSCRAERTEVEGRIRVRTAADPQRDHHRRADRPLAAAPGKQHPLERERECLERFVEDTPGEKGYCAQQVMKWIHHRYVTDFDQMTALGTALRAKLHAHAEVGVPNVVFDKP